MTLAAGRLRLQVPVLLLSHYLLSIGIYGMGGSQDGKVFAAPSGAYTGRNAGWNCAAERGVTCWDTYHKTFSLCWPRNELPSCRRLAYSPELHTRCCSQNGFLHNASLIPSTNSCSRPASEGHFSETAHCGSRVGSSTAAAAAAEAKAASTAAAFAIPPAMAGLGDAPLPPQSTTAPLVDPYLCSDDFLPSRAHPPSGGAASHWLAQGTTGLFRAVPWEGPVSFFDGRKELHPSLAGASDDAFFIDFYGPIQLGAAEVAQSALSAAKRFVRARELNCRRFRRTEQKVSGGRKYPESCAEEQEQSRLDHCNDQERCTNLHVSSIDLFAILKQERFIKPPYWLVERVAYALRYVRPPSFGFLVAQMLQALCTVAEVERKLGITIDDFASLRMQTYIRKLRQMKPAQHAMHLTKGSPRAFNDVLKFRRGFPVFPWGLSVDHQTTYKFMQQNLQVTEETLTQVTVIVPALPRPQAEVHVNSFMHM